MEGRSWVLIVSITLNVLLLLMLQGTFFDTQRPLPPQPDLSHREEDVPHLTTSGRLCNGRPPGTYFIDLGANCGNSYQVFLNRNPNLPSNFRAYLFEFNPNLIKKYLRPLLKKDNRVELVEAAATVDDGFMVAYLDKRVEKKEIPCVAQEGKPNPAGASSILSVAPRAGIQINVSRVDVPKWLAAEFCPADEIHLKIDIEGAEYDLLEALVTQGVHCLPDRYYIEFHNWPEYVTVSGQRVKNHQGQVLFSTALKKCSILDAWL